jgi:HEAT repeat protein
VGEKAFTAIRALLDDKDKNIVVVGINSVGAMGAVGEPFLPELNALAEKGNVDVRAKAILALGRVNPNEPKSLAVLKECARDLDSAIRLSAVSALQNAPYQVWNDDSLFETLLNDPDPNVRERVRAVLGEKNPLKGH